MSKIEVDTIDTQSSTTLQVGSTNTSLIKIGTSGDTVEYPAGTTFTQSGTQNVTSGGAINVKSGGSIIIESGAAITNNGTATGFSADLTNLNATNLTSGTVPNARYGTPTFSGANLTNLNATNLASGTVPDARFPATLPAISGANLTNLPASGITEADWWRITTEFNGSATPIASNWERCDSAGFGKIGTGVSQSSGVFSFPSTGVWQMLGQQGMYYSGSIRYARLDLETTVDNTSNWVTSGSRYSFINNVSNNTYSGMNCNIIFNCSNISTHKFRMSIVKENESVTTTATSASTQTGCMFIRLGDSV